tara:strand:+ start:5769 stop:6329 length:561 start_codon:yes stop_codon:yes gene_type:complete
MIISFTGAQSTGKTTLLNIMHNSPAFRKWSFINEVTRKVARKGHIINDIGDSLDVTQLFIINEHLKNHHLPGDVILDRCMLDGYIYTKYLHSKGKVNDWVYEYAENMLTILLSKIDIIFYTDPRDVELHDDGTRSTNKQFRQDIINEYDNYLTKYRLCKDCNNLPDIINLQGDVPTRLHTITRTLI